MSAYALLLALCAAPAPRVAPLTPEALAGRWWAQWGVYENGWLHLYRNGDMAFERTLKTSTSYLLVDVGTWRVEGRWLILTETGHWRAAGYEEFVLPTIYCIHFPRSLQSGVCGTWTPFVLRRNR